MTLPKGWATTTLGDCQGKTNSVDPCKEPATEFDLFSVPAYSAYQPDRARGDEIGSTKQQVRGGDVLLCKIVPHIRRGWVVPPKADRPQIASGEWIVFRDNALEPEFLRRFVLSDQFHEQFMQTVSGVGGSLMRARPAEAGKIGVPVPPAAEQRRIVAKLDALTARLARARTELDRVPVLAERLRAIALADAFAPDGRGHVTMGELLADVRYGTAQKCDYGGGKSPVLRIPNVQGGKIDLTDLKSSTFTTKELTKLSLQAGDVLVIRSNGSLDLVGKSAVVEGDAAGMLYAGYLIRLRPLPGAVVPRFLHYFLSSPTARTALTGAARSTSGVNNVNAQQLQALKVPVRSVEEQEVIVGQIDNAFARADRMEAEAARARALLDRLEAAILGRAFRGELVPQDPNDEPAHVLLDRIRAERAAAPKAKRGRKKASG